MPKPVRTSKEDINVVSVRVTRRSSEHESIDLAAEATASAPAKSLDLVKPTPADARAGNRPGKERK